MVDPGKIWVMLEPLCQSFLDDVGSHIGTILRPDLVQKELSREILVMKMKDVRDLRRDFMAACGASDDGYFTPEEGAILQAVAEAHTELKTVYGITEKEIDEAVLPFTTSTGRKTTMPQFTPRIDL